MLPVGEPLDAHGIETAVDDHLHAGDETACLVGGEQEGGSDQFIGFAEAVHRGVAYDLCHALGGEDLAVLFGRKEARNQGVDPDSVWRPFAGQIAAEVVHRPLGGRVGEDPGKGIEAGN